MIFKPKFNIIRLSQWAVVVLITLVAMFPVVTSAQTDVVDPASTTSTPAMASSTSLVANFSLIAQSGLLSPSSQEQLKKEQNLRSEEAARLDNYFTKWDMPLAGYGQVFVKAAEKCHLDWRLLPAISVRESSGGKHLMNNNPFGWGSAQIKFKDFNQAIDVVSDNLCGYNAATAQYYKDKSTYQILWSYNGSVLPEYPNEVLAIMNLF